MVDWVQLTSNALFLGMNAFLIQRLTRHLDKMEAKLVLSEQRHNVKDRILSAVIGVPFSSEAIANNTQPYPQMSHKHPKMS